MEIDQAISVMEMMKMYIIEILRESGYEESKCQYIAEKLVSGFYNHGEVITFEKAKSIGLNVCNHDKYPEIWSAFREWLRKYILKSADKHIIRYVIPNIRGG